MSKFPLTSYSVRIHFESGGKGEPFYAKINYLYDLYPRIK